MTREGERELVKVEHVNGGDGYIVREAMVTSEEVEKPVRCMPRFIWIRDVK